MVPFGCPDEHPLRTPIAAVAVAVVVAAAAAAAAVIVVVALAVALEGVAGSAVGSSGPCNAAPTPNFDLEDFPHPYQQR